MRNGEWAKAQPLSERKTLRTEFFVLPMKGIFRRRARHRRFAVSHPAPRF